MDDDKWRARILAGRASKDDFFAKSPGSPVPETERATFAGLPYYDPDPRYRFVLDLHEEEPQALDVPRSAGDTVSYERVGTFRFETPEGPAQVAAYRTEDHGDDLFLMFRDTTSGTETYGGGRYLEAKQLKSGRWYVDFNRAYHPYCVYDDAFTCPLPPPENWLKVPVPAGERL